MLYRRFYSEADTSILIMLYLTQVRPSLEYVVQVWDPHLVKDTQALESVQKFAPLNVHKNVAGLELQ